MRPSLPRHRTPSAAAALVGAAAALLVAGCSRSDGAGAPARRAPPGAAERGAPAPFDWREPARALSMDAGEVAARLGSFDWTGEATWSTQRGERRAGATERHHLRQLVDGPFAAESDIDPGDGPGSETGMRVVLVDGMTWARSRHAASGSWRERPSDHGREARRLRDQAFGGAREVAELLGPSLRLVPQGDGVALGRPARRFAIQLDRSRFEAGPSRAGASVPPPKDPASDDTATRLAFLDGREPLEASGELLADAASGAPLAVRLTAAFGVKGDPDARIEVSVDGRVTALGAAVAAVRPPTPSLPDERKPRGVARALERAGLRKKGATEEPAETGGEPE